MWRRTYLLLILVRLYFALSPSYLHPDENFQGPEVIAGRVFAYPAHLTWEFTADLPIRSVFPLWLVYGLPMYALRGLWEGSGKGEVPPELAYYTLRVIMFILSFVLEDWAIQELVASRRQRRVAVLLVASSYVTWTWQTHTFSNSIETLALLWSLVLIAWIVEDKQHSSVFASAVLAFCLVLGTFTRITFPAFVVIPGLGLFPHFWRKPFALVSMILFGGFTLFLALSVDTSFYNPSEPFNFRRVLLDPVITPLNNLRYNSSHINLAEHGIHPYYQHLVANLPQLLGPAFPLLFISPRRSWRLYAAACGTVALSCVPHQEARFLLPAVPLILSSIRLPRRHLRAWLAAWLLFNAALGALLGVYHQGGVVPAQIFLSKQQHIRKVFYWKTYSPPVWLVNGNATGTEVVDLMGMPGEDLVGRLSAEVPCSSASSGSWRRTQRPGSVVLAAPLSATFLDPYLAGNGSSDLGFVELWRYRRHLNLDDMEFADDGVWETIKRVVGRRGLGLWKVERKCS